MIRPQIQFNNLMWNKLNMKRSLISLVAAAMLWAMTGCGKDQAMMVGNPSEKGLIRESKDAAAEVGTKATERNESNDLDLYGG
jgi:hypothetical protein